MRNKIKKLALLNAYQQEADVSVIDFSKPAVLVCEIILKFCYFYFYFYFVWAATLRKQKQNKNKTKQNKTK